MVLSHQNHNRVAQHSGGLGCNVILLFLVAVALAVSLNWEALRDWTTHLLQSLK